MPYDFRIFNEVVGTASKQMFCTQRHDDTLIKSSDTVITPHKHF